MNPDQPSREQIEARLTALLLGELPHEEAELLRWTIERDPELKKLHDQLKLTIGFVREAMKNPTGAPVEKETPLKMSAERRQKLLAHFKTDRPKPLVPPLPRKMSPLIVALVVVVIIAGLAAISIPNFVKARATSQASATINNLRQIDAAKNEWALENRKSKGAVVTEDDITPYIQLDSNGNIPKCPAGGTYVIGKVGEPAMAELKNGKVLTEPSGTMEFALRAPSPSAVVAQSVRRNPQASTTPPPMAQIVLPKTESSQVESEQDAGAVYTQNIVGYVNFDFGKASPMPVQPEPNSAPVAVTGIPPAPASAAPQPEPEAQPTAAGGNYAMSGSQPNSTPVIEAPAPSPLSAPAQPQSEAGPIFVTANPPSHLSMPTQTEGQTASAISGRASTASTLPPNSSPFANRLGSVEGLISSSSEQAAKNGNRSYGGGAGGGGGGGAGGISSNAYANNTFSQAGSAGVVTFGSAYNGFASVNHMRSAAPHPSPSDNFTITNALADNPGAFYRLANNSVVTGDRNVGGKANSWSALVQRQYQNRKQAIDNDDKLVAVTPIPGSAAPQVMGDIPATSTAPTPTLTEAQMQSYNERLMESQAAKSNDQSQVVRGQPYWEAERALHNKETLHQMLAAKIESEKADTTIPKSAIVEIISPAQSAQSQNLWQRLTGEVESQTRIKVNPDVVTDISTFSGGPGENAPYDPYFTQTEVKSIQSDAVLGKVVDALKLDRAWSKSNDGERLSREDAISQLRSRLDLQADRNTKEIEIGAKSDKPDEAPEIANAVAEAYKQYRLEMHSQEMNAGIAVLQKKYADEEAELSFMQSNVNNLRAELSIHDSSALPQNNPANNEVIPPGMIDFRGVDVNQVLEVYAQMTGRKLLRSSLPMAQIVFKNETPLTRTEAIQALQQALALKGIAVINVGDSFVKAVPAAEAGTAAAQTDKPLPAPMVTAPIPQPEIQTRDNAFSTFSLNVSDASFKLAEASLQNGQMPNPDSIRAEEFINAFDYRDPEPLQGQPLAFMSERARDPFAQERDVLRFSIKAAALGRQEGRALNLVLLLDTSGSMERADRVAIIREALRVLATQLQPQDTVSVVTFARTARLWADGVPGGLAGITLEKVGSITPEGGTNLEEAMRLAYATARQHFIAGGMNRVVLLTDGAANLGNVNPQTLTKRVEAQRRKGIALDCFGIGWEDYNDDMLEQLSSNGDGRYAFINSPDEAGTEFAAKLAGALQVAAEDVKVQVEFNPDRVTAWRQIGYAKHQLTKQQFRDNTVAAGTIASREAGNALYVIETKPDGEGPIATVRVRYRVPGTQDNRERSWLVDYTGTAPALAQASPAMRLAVTGAEFSEWLSDSPYAQNVTPDDLLNYLSGIPQVYGTDEHPKQLEWMIRQAKSVSGK